MVCPFGDERKVVEISQPIGGGEGYHIHIDRYYKGVLLYRDNRWIGYFHESTMFTAEDVDILIEIINPDP